jgi:hypothetical protein
MIQAAIAILTSDESLLILRLQSNLIKSSLSIGLLKSVQAIIILK